MNGAPIGNSIVAFWARVRATRESLPPAASTFWVAGVGDLDAKGRPGQLAEVGRNQAAELITTGTHRLATPAEIESWMDRTAIRTGAGLLRQSGKCDARVMYRKDPV